MKKLLKLGLISCMCMMALVGCGTKEKPQSNLDGTVNQFAEVKEGETIAEMNVKGFGTIYIKFFDEVAPKAVENFVTHAKNGYYDGLTYHRILNDFMIQGGDPTGTGTAGESIWGTDFEDEYNENLQPLRGALCMANRGPGTNGSQFFIVQTEQKYDAATMKEIAEFYKKTFNDEAIKNYEEIGGTPWLYESHTVFGQVYEGMDVVDAIAAVEADANGVPAEPVVIDSIKITEYTK